jgi:hypothetical protein
MESKTTVRGFVPNAEGMCIFATQLPETKQDPDGLKQVQRWGSCTQFLFLNSCDMSGVLDRTARFVGDTKYHGVIAYLNVPLFAGITS